MPAQSPQVGDGTQECKGIKLLGFEFTVYTLILVVVLIVCVAYFLYKYFFTRTDLVVYKKNLPKEIREIKGVKENKEIKKNKDKIKEEELSNRSNASNTSSSSTNQTLEM
jgi:type III secretory pathway component EscU